LLRAKMATLPDLCFQPNRNTWGYMAFVAVAVVLAVPMVIVAFISLMLDYVMYYVFSVPFCLLTCRWGSYWQSQAALAPYRGGPSLMLVASDIVTALMGQVWRQGWYEANFMLASLWICIPWIKYYVNANPFLYPLESRYVQQITTSMQDIPIQGIATALNNLVVTCKLADDLRAEGDDWKFLPHYPYPPPWKRWNVGVQAGGKVRNSNLFFLFVHTTHSYCDHGGSTEQFVLSNSARSPWTRVMLWYNNPYHFLTGWVEAEVSTGLPSQPDKNRGGEHPMWLVGAHSPFHSSRKSSFTVGYIDEFFDTWLPKVVYHVRKYNCGADAASELYEEVISKDGRSRPAQKKQIPLVDE